MYHINSMLIEGRLKDRPMGERFTIESRKNKDIIVSVPCVVKKESLYPILNILREGMKIRVLGSTILHILSPVLFPSIEGVVVQKCFAWDIAAAHAVILSEGMDLSDADGTPFRYTEGFVFGKEKLSRILYGGTDAARSELRRVLPPR